MLQQVADYLLLFVDTFLAILVRVVLVPGVLILIFLLSWLVAFQSTSAYTQYPHGQGYTQVQGKSISRILAFLFGVVSFVIASVSTFSGQQTQAVQFEGLLSNFLVLVLIGAFLGLTIMVSMDKFLKSQAASIFVAVLSFSSLTGLYFYALAAQVRNPVLIIVLGLLAGGLFYGAFIHVPEDITRLQIRNLGRTVRVVAIVAISITLAVTIVAIVVSPGGLSLPTTATSSPTGAPHSATPTPKR